MTTNQESSHGHHGIPIIDMKRETAAEELADAFESIGFATLINHCVDVKVMDAAFAASRQFFALPVETKLQSKYRSHESNRGYIPFQAEFHSKDLLDLKETFDIGWDNPDNDSCCNDDDNDKQTFSTPWPPDEAVGIDMKLYLMQYFEACNDLFLRIMRLLGQGMRLSNPDFFLDKCHDKHCNLRLLHYPALSDPQHSMKDSVLIRGGRHTDFGVITLLAQDAVGGLRVQRRGQESWTPVPPVPHSFVVNVGDMLQRWTNDRLVATPHQVVSYRNHHDTGTIVPERFSIAFFCNANKLVLLNPSDFCKPGVTPKYEPVQSMDYITGRLAATISNTYSTEEVGVCVGTNGHVSPVCPETPQPAGTG